MTSKLGTSAPVTHGQCSNYPRKAPQTLGRANTERNNTPAPLLRIYGKASKRVFR